MVKVLVPGRNRIYTTVCKWCRSVLEYQQDDIVEEDVEEARKEVLIYTSFKTNDFIKCPQLRWAYCCCYPYLGARYDTQPN